MTRFRKRLTAEQLMEINEKFINDAQNLEPIEQSKDNDDDDKKNPLTNKGTLIVDATCAPSQIKYPRDHEHLSEGRKKLEGIPANLTTVSAFVIIHSPRRLLQRFP